MPFGIRLETTCKIMATSAVSHIMPLHSKRECRQRSNSSFDGSFP